MADTTKHLTAAERRAATVGTVVELAAEQNPSDITTAAIAQRMGVTQGALFRHFVSKEAILKTVMGWISRQLLGRIDAVAKDQTSSLAALKAMFMAHTEFVSSHPGVPRLVFGQLQQAEDSVPRQVVKKLTADYGLRLRQHLQAGKDDGQFAPDLDVNAAAVQFIGMIQGLVIQSLLADDPSHVERHAASVFALYARGLKS
ncbi:TetR/AcrR family transcriptional regulator [Castellaniella sp.]|jgi:AcrR family transcriptional regulator|uniref:TetR/AcrR family transcriptional regulator n=1 Tax=Castellaniella sp. TaxID=1955812 RepID=UPI003A9325B7